MLHLYAAKVPLQYWIAGLIILYGFMLLCCHQPKQRGKERERGIERD
jgi:hypothetical protein